MVEKKVGEEGSAKIVIIGDKKVGKTALIIKCITKRFLPEYVSGYDSNRLFRTEFEGKKVTLELVDSNRQNELQISLADGFVVVYSVTSKSSWEKVKDIIHQVKKANTTNKPIAIVGNKIDLVHFREVSKEDGIKLSKKLKVSLFYEVSVANDNGGISRVFTELYRKVEKRRSLVLVRPTSQLNSFNVALLTVRFFAKLHSRMRDQAMNTILAFRKPKRFQKNRSIDL